MLPILNQPWNQIVDMVYDTDYVQDVIAEDNKSNEELFKNWMLQREHLGILFDKRTIAFVFRIWKRMQKDQDAMILIVGNVGSGKSTLAMNLASWIDPSFSNQQVHFNKDTYLKQLKTSPPGTAHILDEGANDLFGRQAMTKGNVGFMKLFMAMRAKRQCTIINIPDYGLLEKPVRKRLNLLIEMSPNYHFRAYFGEAIKTIHTNYDKFKIIRWIRVPSGYFYDGYSRMNAMTPLVDLDLYSSVKDTYINGLIDVLAQDDKPRALSIGEAARMLGINYHTVMRLVKGGKIEATKLGGRWFIPSEVINKVVISEDRGALQGAEVPNT